MTPASLSATAAASTGSDTGASTASEQSQQQQLRCERWVARAMEQLAPSALRHQLYAYCAYCAPGAAYGAWFDAAQKHLVVCSSTPSPAATTMLVRHELVHAVDVLLEGVDLDNDDALACSEIRAYRWAQCRNEFWFLRASCVRRSVVPSLQQHFADDEKRVQQLITANLARCMQKADIVHD